PRGSCDAPQGAGGPRPHRHRLMRLLILLLTLVLPASAAGATRFAPVTQPSPPLTVKRADLRASLHCTDSVRDASREPVLLESATGVDSDQNYSWNYERAFESLGIPYCTTDQPGQDATNL